MVSATHWVGQNGPNQTWMSAPNIIGQEGLKLSIILFFFLNQDPLWVSKIPNLRFGLFWFFSNPLIFLIDLYVFITYTDSIAFVTLYLSHIELVKLHFAEINFHTAFVTVDLSNCICQILISRIEFVILHLSNCIYHIALVILYFSQLASCNMLLAYFNLLLAPCNLHLANGIILLAKCMLHILHYAISKSKSAHCCLLICI